jgi:hypothetical protein
MSGRKTKLTVEVIGNIANWLKLGYYQEDAAVMAGIAESTFYKWMKEARALEEGEKEPENANDELLMELIEAVKKSRAESEGAHIRNIRRASDNGIWQASAWFLERSHPKKWGRRSALELSGEDGKPIEFEIKYADG